MLEKKISSDDEVIRRYRKVGVVVFVVADDGKILLLKENGSNPDTAKGQGEYGVLCETSRLHEVWTDTVMRGFSEELGLGEGKAREALAIDLNTSYLGETSFVEGVLARVLAVGWRRGKQEALQLEGDGEISVVGWESIDGLGRYNLRRGVRNVLNDCLENGLLETVHRLTMSTLIPLSIGSLGMIDSQWRI